MRFLHTADWHLGRRFFEHGLLAEQAAFVDWLVATARAERVDAVLVSGDVYDRALPPADAVGLASEALERLADDGRQVIVISGNHDSAARLGFGSKLLARAGVHLRTNVAGIAVPVPVRDVAVFGVPYLEPESVADALGCASQRTHAAVLRAALDRVRAAARGPSVVLAHAFVAGAYSSASERDLAMGGAGAVDAGLLGGFAYVALGHLHGPQKVGATGRYAGSPLAFSFSEARQRKSVVVGAVAADGTVATTLAACPVPRPLARLRGTLDELLGDRAHEAWEQAWVEVTLTDAERPADAMPRLRRRFPWAATIAWEPEGALPAAPGSYGDRLRGLGDEEILAGFVRDVRGSEPGDEELALLCQALAAGRVGERVG